MARSGVESSFGGGDPDLQHLLLLARPLELDGEKAVMQLRLADLDAIGKGEVRLN